MSEYIYNEVNSSFINWQFNADPPKIKIKFDIIRTPDATDSSGFTSGKWQKGTTMLVPLGATITCSNRVITITYTENNVTKTYTDTLQLPSSTNATSSYRYGYSYSYVFHGISSTGTTTVVDDLTITGEIIESVSNYWVTFDAINGSISISGISGTGLCVPKTRTITFTGNTATVKDNTNVTRTITATKNNDTASTDVIINQTYNSKQHRVWHTTYVNYQWTNTSKAMSDVNTSYNYQFNAQEVTDRTYYEYRLTFSQLTTYKISNGYGRTVTVYPKLIITYNGSSSTYTYENATTTWYIWLVEGTEVTIEPKYQYKETRYLSSEITFSAWNSCQFRAGNGHYYSYPAADTDTDRTFTFQCSSSYTTYNFVYIQGYTSYYTFDALELADASWDLFGSFSSETATISFDAPGTAADYFSASFSWAGGTSKTIGFNPNAEGYSISVALDKGSAGYSVTLSCKHSNFHTTYVNMTVKRNAYAVSGYTLSMVGGTIIFQFA